MSRPWSIRNHLSILVFFAILPIVVLLVQTTVLDVRENVELAEENSRRASETTAATMDRFLRESADVVADLATRAPIREGDAVQCTNLLEDALDILPRFANIFVANTEGRIFCSALPTGPGGVEVVLDRDWFFEAVHGRAFTIGAPQLGRISDRWVAVLAYPVLDEARWVRGVIGAAIDLIELRHILAAVPLPEGTVVTIDDTDGVVVARSVEAEEWVGRPLPASGLDQGYLREERGLTRVPGAEGEERFWAFTAIPDSPWRAWVGIPATIVHAPARQAVMRKALLLVLALIGIGSIALVLNRRIGAALTELVNETEHVGAGEDTRVTVTGPEEVRKVAEQFNRTLEARGRSEAKHRQSLERYRSVMEHALFGIFVTDANDRIREANPALSRLLGARDPETLRNRPFSSLFDDPVEAARLQVQLDDGRPVAGVQVVWHGPNGVPIQIRLHGSVYRDRDGEPAYEWMVEDVTERITLEERMREVQKLEAVGRLAGGVAHDFNNLLTVITTSAHLLQEDQGAGSEIGEAASQILDAATQGAALTRQLLTFSRKQVLQPERLELNQVVRRMEGLLRRLTGDGIELVIDLEEPGGAVEADPAQLQQVLMNLVLNARDATEGFAPVGIGSRTVTLDRETAEANGLAAGRYLQLRVSDQGHGIPPEIRDRIFEPFFTTKPDGRGTGLGLATVYGIATQAGGTVTVESQPGRGSVFTVYLPRLSDDSV